MFSINDKETKKHHDYQISADVGVVGIKPKAFQPMSLQQLARTKNALYEVVSHNTQIKMELLRLTDRDMEVMGSS